MREADMLHHGAAPPSRRAGATTTAARRARRLGGAPAVAEASVCAARHRQPSRSRRLGPAWLKVLRFLHRRK